MNKSKSKSVVDKSKQRSQMRHKEAKKDHAIGYFAMTAPNGDNDMFHQEQRRNEREKIRKKLAAMDSDNEDLCIPYETNSPGNGSVNLQICFINDSLHNDSPLTIEPTGTRLVRNAQIPSLKQYPAFNRLRNGTSLQNVQSCQHSTAQSFSYWQRPSFFFNRHLRQRPSFFFNQSDNRKDRKPLGKEDIFSYHARLQADVRIALAEAKEMARMQIAMERQQRKYSPLSSLIGITFPDGWCKLDRILLNKMNIAQIQVIVNDLHSQIENLNDDLVRMLLERDDLHMEQDSMLVDIEDLTQHLGLKGNSKK